MSDYLNHESPAGHYRVNYPGDWMHMSVSATDAFFFSNLQGPDDAFSDHISIRAEDVTRLAPSDLQAIADATAASMGRSEPGFSVEGSRPDKVSGREALRLEFRSSGAQDLRYDSVIVVDGPLAYHLTYTAEAGTFDAFADVFQAMLDSFELQG